MSVTSEKIPAAITDFRRKLIAADRSNKAALAVCVSAWRETLDARRDSNPQDVQAIPFGRRFLKRLDLDAPFMRAELSDTALTAAVWATWRFDSHFPGWQLYRRITVGYEAFDEELLAWAAGCAWILARAKTRSGRDYLRSDARGPWINWAAADALHWSIYGRFPINSDKRGYVRGVRFATYSKIREPVLACILLGAGKFQAELQYQYSRAAEAQKDEKEGKLLSKDGLSWRDYPHGVSNPMLRVAAGNGCTYTMPAPIHD